MSRKKERVHEKGEGRKGYLGKREKEERVSYGKGRRTKGELREKGAGRRGNLGKREQEERVT